MASIQLFRKRLDSFNKAANTLLDNLEICKLEVFAPQYEVSKLLKCHRIKSKILDILSNMLDIEESVEKVNSLLDGESQMVDAASDSSDHLLNKTISDMTPFLYLYFQSLRDTAPPASQKNDKLDDVD